MPFSNVADRAGQDYSIHWKTPGANGQLAAGKVRLESGFPFSLRSAPDFARLRRTAHQRLELDDNALRLAEGFSACQESKP